VKRLLKLLSSKKENTDNSKINLLIETDSFDKGGLQKVILDQSLFLNRKKFNPIIVNINKSGYLGKIAASKGIKVYNLSGIFNKKKSILK